MSGPGSDDISIECGEHNDAANNVWSSLANVDVSCWADIPVEIPLDCLETLEGTPILEPPNSCTSAISGATASLMSAHSADLVSPGNVQTLVAKQPCDTYCATTISPSPGSPGTNTSPPPQATAPDASAVPLIPPSWAEPQSASDAQRAAAICVQTGAITTPGPGPVHPSGAAEPLNTPLQRASLPRLRPAPKADGFALRNRAKMATTGAHYTDLSAQKAALERELVTLLNRHESLSRGLPWRMQHEEVSFMASIARCMAAGRSCNLAPISETVLEPSETLLQKLMLAPCETMNGVYKAAGIGSAFPEDCEPSLGLEYSNTTPKNTGTKGPVWSSIVTFLKLSKRQKDRLATAYNEHVQRAAALQRECRAIGAKLQAEAVLKPSLAMHLACGQLTGIAKEDKDLVPTLNKECHEVLNQVQLNNLLALAPGGSVAALGLCREIATTHGAAATKSAAIEADVEADMHLTKRHRQATRHVDASVHALAGANIAVRDAHGSAVVTSDITTAAAALATDADGAANAIRNASAQASPPKQATGIGARKGTSARVIDAGTPLSRRRKRQTADSSWASEGRPASKAQSSSGMPAVKTPNSACPLPSPQPDSCYPI